MATTHERKQSFLEWLDAQPRGRVLGSGERSGGRDMEAALSRWLTENPILRRENAVDPMGKVRGLNQSSRKQAILTAGKGNLLRRVMGLGPNPEKQGELFSFEEMKDILRDRRKVGVLQEVFVGAPSGNVKGQTSFEFKLQPDWEEKVQQKFTVPEMSSPPKLGLENVQRSDLAARLRANRKPGAKGIRGSSTGRLLEEANLPDMHGPDIVPTPRERAPYLKREMTSRGMNLTRNFELPKKKVQGPPRAAKAEDLLGSSINKVIEDHKISPKTSKVKKPRLKAFQETLNSFQEKTLEPVQERRFVEQLLGPALDKMSTKGQVVKGNLGELSDAIRDRLEGYDSRGTIPEAILREADARAATLQDSKKLRTIDKSTVPMERLKRLLGKVDEETAVRSRKKYEAERVVKGTDYRKPDLSHEGLDWEPDAELTDTQKRVGGALDDLKKDLETISRVNVPKVQDGSRVLDRRLQGEIQREQAWRRIQDLDASLADKSAYGEANKLASALLADNPDLKAADLKAYMPTMYEKVMHGSRKNLGLGNAVIEVGGDGHLLVNGRSMKMAELVTAAQGKWMEGRAADVLGDVPGRPLRGKDGKLKDLIKDWTPHRNLVKEEAATEARAAASKYEGKHLLHGVLKKESPNKITAAKESILDKAALSHKSLGAGANSRSVLVGALQAERGGGVGAEEFFKAQSPDKYASLVKRIKEGDTGAIAEFKEILRSIEANKPMPSPSASLRVRPSNLQAAAGSIGDLEDVDLMGIEPDSPEKLDDIRYKREMRGTRNAQIAAQRELPPIRGSKTPNVGTLANQLANSQAPLDTKRMIRRLVRESGEHQINPKVEQGAHYPAYDYTGKETRSWKPKPNAVLNRKEGYGLLDILQGSKGPSEVPESIRKLKELSEESKIEHLVGKLKVPNGDPKMAELVGKVLKGGGREALEGQAEWVQEVLRVLLQLPK